MYHEHGPNKIRPARRLLAEGFEEGPPLADRGLYP
jgi:hypothetical protein